MAILRRLVSFALGTIGFFLVLTAWAVTSSRGTPVEGAVAQKKPLTQTLLVTGRLAPPNRTTLGATLQATVVELVVDEGDPVDQGDVVARLSDDEAAARVREAQAQVNEAYAHLRRLRGVGREVANEALKQADVAAEQAERDFDRMSAMFEKKHATEADYEAARRRMEAARSQRTAAQLQAAASAKGGADTAAAIATLSRAQAALDLARTNLEKTEIRAPMEGVVLKTTVEVGQVVRPGDSVVEMASNDALEVRITPDEQHLGRLEVGQSAAVVTDAFPDRPIHAEVAQIAPQVDASRGTVEVRLALSDEIGDLALRPDMTATVEILIGKRPDALVIPIRAVRDLATGEPYVLVDEGGTAVRHPVKIGLQGMETIEITDGLDEGDVVLTQLGFADGDAVRVQLTEG